MKNTSIELGRCIAALAVIVIHCSGSYLGDVNNDAWIVAEILNAASRFAVPFFFMASGAFVVGRTVFDCKQYISKRGARLILPYIFGSLFYLVWSYWYQGARFEPFDWVFDFLRGASWFHLWFLPAMFAVSMLSVFCQGLKRDNVKSVRIVVALLLSISAVNTMLEIGKLTLGNFLASSVYFEYFVCGWVVSHSRKIPIVGSSIIFILCTLAIGATSIASKAFGYPEWSTAFDSYASPFVIGQSISFYYLVTSICTPQKMGIFAVRLSHLTLGIYVFHHAVMVMLMDVFNQSLNASQFTILVCVPVSTFVICAILTSILKYIPIIRSCI
ncbi:acyltransferase [Agrobacterium fabrum]|uniref:acyltransferase n=1 Tax=Agrobacterium fabrum TaxID=1176649 RepID=UPI002473A65D|nr:acyltransferase [Agrobacterium fabrum]MDH6296591.1 surface polysaccharide O-acyltransferase-like enzyme [Agrobacterium fabrum]